MPAPSAPGYVEIKAGPQALWLQADLPMRARVWAALGVIHRARRSRAADMMAYTALPDTLRPGAVEEWLYRHDALSDAWMAEIAKGLAPGSVSALS